MCRLTLLAAAKTPANMAISMTPRVQVGMQNCLFAVTQSSCPFTTAMCGALLFKGFLLCVPNHKLNDAIYVLRRGEEL